MGRHPLTDDEYAAALNEQAGLCAICLTPAADGARNLAVDHSHETGDVRGLLCTRCNLGLGYFKDDPTRLLTAYRYLLRGQVGDPGDALVGRWFMSLVPRDDLGGDIGPQWQGQIVGRTAQGLYLAQTYSFWDGGRCNILLVPHDELAGWEFFNTDAEMRDRYDHHWFPRMKRQAEQVRATERRKLGPLSR